MIQKSYDGKNALYLIPTPIGNMEDITMRALNILKLVDYVLCEDTRVTKVLLDYFNLKKKLVSCHEHNEDTVKKRVLEDLKDGKNIGLVTDQGSPIISDPGYRVVEYVTQNNQNVIALPGATAFVPALMTSGIDSSKFIFYGFTNAKHSKRIKELEILKPMQYTIVFYEAVHRIKEFIDDLYNAFGNRKVVIARELSKLHEEIYRGSLEELKNCDITLKGEFVIVVGGNKENIDYSDISIIEHVKMYIEEGNSEKDAIKLVAKDRKVAKSDIYKEYHINK